MFAMFTTSNEIMTLCTCSLAQERRAVRRKKGAGYARLVYVHMHRIFPEQ